MKNCCNDTNNRFGKRKRRGRQADYRFLLVGNPNVGKSAVFNQLTGLGIVTANYPGTTVEINEGYTKFKGYKIKVTDVPGTYALSGVSEDQWVARQAVLEQDADCLIVITDATNLQRNLYIVLQLIDMGMPVVVCLNLIDMAESKKITTDIKKMEKMIGVPVVPTVAIQGKGLDTLIDKAIESTTSKRRYHYGTDIEKQAQTIINEVSKEKDLPYGMNAEGIAFLLMEDDGILKEMASKNRSAGIDTALKKVKETVARSHGQPLSVRLALERHGLAGAITSAVQRQGMVKRSFTDRLWKSTTNPLIGMSILLLSTTVFFALVVGSGILLSGLFDKVWQGTASVWINSALTLAVGDSIVKKVLMWGFSDGIQAALGIGVAFILPFYVLLAVLEDSGYLNSIAFLTDRLAHRMGLHGRSFIPLISGAGCNVPAIMGTRALGSKREKLIASTLITMVPCSARTAVILGTVALFAGWAYTGILYLLILAIIFITGVSLNKVLPGKSTGLVMEMFPLRVPSLKMIFKKTWVRLRGFLSVAFPFIIIGSLVMGVLFETGLLMTLSKPLSFLTVGFLGLPAVTGLVLLAGFLRKEMALELLVVLAAAQYGSGFKGIGDLMDPKQMFVFALVVSLYIPCIATFSVLVKELDWKKATLIGLFTILIAFIAGGLVNYGFKIL